MNDKMTKPVRKQIYLAAFRKWGFEAQHRQLMEECAELIQATNKYLNLPTEETVASFVEELADVEIMIEQIKLQTDYLLLEDRVEKQKESALLSLKTRVMKDKEGSE